MWEEIADARGLMDGPWVICGISTPLGSYIFSLKKEMVVGEQGGWWSFQIC